VVTRKPSGHVSSGRQDHVGSRYDGTRHHGVLSILLRYHGWETPSGAKQSVSILTDQSTSDSSASVPCSITVVVSPGLPITVARWRVPSKPHVVRAESSRALPSLRASSCSCMRKALHSRDM